MPAAQGDGMSDWKERLQKEHQELFERMSKLASFLRSSAVVELEQNNTRLLHVQLKAMDTYLSVLSQRMDLNGIEKLGGAV